MLESFFSFAFSIISFSIKISNIQVLILFISKVTDYLFLCNLGVKGNIYNHYSHCGRTLFQPAANKVFHSFIARFRLMRLRIFRSGIPFLSSLPLSISTFGFASQLSQSYLNLRIHAPLGSLSHPSCFISTTQEQYQCIILCYCVWSQQALSKAPSIRKKGQMVFIQIILQLLF